ncbi:MAG: tetratricopeptide repeat protein [Smithella sp.]|nr:tetratricopeptide repeat protein [Smithella sp.]
MQNKMKIRPGTMQVIVYSFLAVAVIIVYIQVSQFDFINIDDDVYVINNRYIQSGITLEGVQWAFKSAEVNNFWYPLTLLSLMFDHQLHGLKAGGYHVHNLILHLLSTFLLFWLFQRMTGAVWRSAFVAAFFALHPLHVESVAWVTERKDVLSGFFWMLTLCLYVWYTEKPDIKRYLLILGSFVLALMSKPMVVTLPVIMILLDYWPLRRFRLQSDKFMVIQLREKTPFFILSAILILITLLAQHDPTEKNYPLIDRLSNAPVSFVTYLVKTFWPHDMAVFYPFPAQIPVWQVLAALLLIVFISIVVISMAKQRPYLFTGWLWYVVAVIPVSGIIQSGAQGMADRFTYLPSIGISIMLAWGVPLLCPREATRKKIIFPSAAAFLIMMSMLAWKQCGYWENSLSLLRHALQVTENNFIIQNNFGSALFETGEIQEAIAHFNESIRINPEFASAYNNRGIVYAKIGNHQTALEDFNTAIRLNPLDANAYRNRAILYGEKGEDRLAVEDLNKAIEIDPDCVNCYYDRAFFYFKQNDMFSVCRDARSFCELKDCDLLERFQKEGYCL